MKVFYLGAIRIRYCRLSLFVLLGLFSSTLWSQQSVARQWSEVMLNCIRKDFARPTVQARTIAHASWAMYDAWAVYDDEAQPYLLGNTVGTYTAPFNGIAIPENRQAAQEKAISYAMYRWLTNRFQTFTPPGSWQNFMSVYINDLMQSLEYDPSITSTDYSDGDPAKLGNYIAQQLIAYGLTDGTNRVNNHANQYYYPVNGNIWADLPGNPECYDPNRWQPLSLTFQIDDQSGFPIPNGAPALSHEWGDALPFSLRPDQKVVKNRDDHDWTIYLDPGDPPYLDTNVQTGIEDLFKWGYITNILWHSFHDPSDGVMMDISPNNVGNLQTLPETFAEFPAFYDMYNAGPNDPGYTVNPATGLPYEPQIVPRADYTRVLSEYWADGPQSETPPGHWVKLFNEVADHPMLVKRWKGEGEILSNLEWDVRGYFAVCSGMYDAAIACWSTKGYYDYTRPIMAIRYMAEKGQSTDPNLPHYHPAGLPLMPGLIELVYEDDPLVGENMENLHKIKLYTWMGPLVDNQVVAGVGWVLGENWMTFQVRSFVTPPFAGYYSGHSTYSRTAAEIMSLLTGDEYFPGGMSEFTAVQNEYLKADEGPSMTIKLQWAKYKDASDQCSLSRIFGGLHPPQDDIPGRKVGMIVGPQVFEKVDGLIQAGVPHVASIELDNLITDADAGATTQVAITFTREMDTTVEPAINFTNDNPVPQTLQLIGGSWTSAFQYVLQYNVIDADVHMNNVVFRVSGAMSSEGVAQLPALSGLMRIDTRNPMVELAYNPATITDATVGNNAFSAVFTFDEAMNQSIQPAISFTNADASPTFVVNASSQWSNPFTYNLVLNAVDANQQLGWVNIATASARDLAGNLHVIQSFEEAVFVDTKNPLVASLTPSDNTLTQENYGSGSFELALAFDEPMNTSVLPEISFPVEDPSSSLTYNAGLSGWQSNDLFVAKYDMADFFLLLQDIDVMCVDARDVNGNLMSDFTLQNVFNINTTVGVLENAMNGSLLVFPNPIVQGNPITVEVKGISSGVTLSIYSSIGQMVHSKTMYPAGQGRISLPTDNLAAGTYLIRAEADGLQMIKAIQIVK